MAYTDLTAKCLLITMPASVCVLLTDLLMVITVCFNSQSDIRIPVDLMAVFQTEDLLGFHANIVLKPDELFFEENLNMDFFYFSYYLHLKFSSNFFFFPPSNFIFFLSTFLAFNLLYFYSYPFHPFLCIF